MAATEYQLPVPSSRYHSVGCTETVGGVEGQVGEIKLVVELVSCHSQAGILRVSLKETVQDEEKISAILFIGARSNRFLQSFVLQSGDPSKELPCVVELTILAIFYQQLSLPLFCQLPYSLSSKELLPTEVIELIQQLTGASRLATDRLSIAIGIATSSPRPSNPSVG